MAKTAGRVSDAERQHQELWDAALECVGRDVVIVQMNIIGATLPGTTFPLVGLPGGVPYPKCEDVQAWLRRTGAAEKAIETTRHRDIYWIMVATVAVGIVAAVAALVAA